MVVAVVTVSATVPPVEAVEQVMARLSTFIVGGPPKRLFTSSMLETEAGVLSRTVPSAAVVLAVSPMKIGTADWIWATPGGNPGNS